MGWFKDAVNSIADAVEDVVNSVTNAVTDVVETIGSGIQNGINAIGNIASGIPVIGNALGNVFKWVGGISSGIFNLAGSLIKSSLGILKSSLSGGIRILGGIVSLDKDLIKKGALSIGAALGGGLIYTTGVSISFFQKIFVLQNFERNLTKDEASRLKKIFQNSILLYNIRIIEGRSGIYGINDYPFTLGNTIYLKDTDLLTEFDVLVHECVHVWQYQHFGSSYTAEAIAAQYSYANAYDWVFELGQPGISSWSQFNREAQAAFMEDVWLHGSLIINGVPTSGNGIFFDLDKNRHIFGIGNVVPEFIFNGNNYTNFAISSIDYMRNI